MVHRLQPTRDVHLFSVLIAALILLACEAVEGSNVRTLVVTQRMKPAIGNSTTSTASLRIKDGRLQYRHGGNTWMTGLRPGAPVSIADFPPGATIFRRRTFTFRSRPQTSVLAGFRFSTPDERAAIEAGFSLDGVARVAEIQRIPLLEPRLVRARGRLMPRARRWFDLSRISLEDIAGAIEMNPFLAADQPARIALVRGIRDRLSTTLQRTGRIAFRVDLDATGQHVFAAVDLRTGMLEITGGTSLSPENPSLPEMQILPAQIGIEERFFQFAMEDSRF